MATILNVYMADAAMKFLAQATPENARLLFRRSLLHLPIVMLAAVAFRLPQESAPQERRAWGDTLQKAEPPPGRAASSGDLRAASRRASALLWEVQTAPFPFLPPPNFERQKDVEEEEEEEGGGR